MMAHPGSVGENIGTYITRTLPTFWGARVESERVEVVTSIMHGVLRVVARQFPAVDCVAIATEERANAGPD